eukprot:3400361-Amphidinium_carterae.1
MRSLHSAHNGYIGHWLKYNECDNEKSVDSGLAHNDTIGVRVCVCKFRMVAEFALTMSEFTKLEEERERQEVNEREKG